MGHVQDVNRCVMVYKPVKVVVLFTSAVYVRCAAKNVMTETEKFWGSMISLFFLSQVHMKKLSGYRCL